MFEEFKETDKLPTDVHHRRATLGYMLCEAYYVTTSNQYDINMYATYYVTIPIQ